jgi:hypothetical protein
MSYLTFSEDQAEDENGEIDKAKSRQDRVS